MITTKKMNSFKQKHFTGESTDNKPTTCGINSLFVEIDTGDTYFFDGYQWIKAELPEHGGITPTGNIAITENTAEGEPLDIAQYATATVNVSGGGGSVPMCTVTIVNNTTTNKYLNDIIDDYKCISENGYFLLDVDPIPANGSANYTLLYAKDEDLYYIGYNNDNLTLTNTVNCEEIAEGDMSGFISPIDETLDSSFTITVTDGGGDIG